jgi:hypothetical protein
MTTNQNQYHLSLVVTDDGSHKAEIRQKIMEATSGLK